MKDLYYIPHTHWDKEWYKTYEEFRVKFVTYFRDILTTLENDKDFKHFMFDGQSSIIDDYLELFPNEKERLKKLIKEKKLLIGPWYTLPDNYVTSGEALVRNLLLGSMIAQEFGHSQNICYIPDSFGQSDQMPQIVKQFNLKGIVLWRGIDSTMTNDAGFIWQGSDGTKIKVIHLPLGYGYSKKIPENGQHQKYIDDIELKLSQKYHNPILLMGGSDHEPIQKKLPNLIKNINEYYVKNNLEKQIFISSLDDFFDNYKIDKNKVSTLYGELRSVKDQRLHYGDTSSRMDLKQWNNKIQIKLAEIVEPILVLNKWLYNYDYPQELINYCWKLLFANQAHDSACTTCTDEVHLDILNRYLKIEQITNELIDYVNRNVLEHSLISDNETIIVYNLKLTKQKHQIIKIETKYKNFNLFDENNNFIKYSILNQEINDKVQTNINYCNYLSMVDAAQDFKNKNKGNTFKNTTQKIYTYTLLIENKFLPMSINIIKIKWNELKNNNSFKFNNSFGNYSVNENGTITYQSKDGKTYNELCYLESQGDDGDSYDYSPPLDNEVFNTLNLKPNIKIIKQNKFLTKIKVIYNWKLPSSLMKNRQKRTELLVNNKVEVEYTFYSFKQSFDVNVIFNNQSIEHLVSLNLKTPIDVTENYAGQQFGTIIRKNELSNDKNWEKTSRSFAYPLYPMQKYCGVKGLIVKTNDSSEYLVENQTLKITLFRSFKYMGKPNLNFRPGRPSGLYWPTPDSKLQKKLNYHFKVLLTENFNNDISNILNDEGLHSFEVIKDMFFNEQIKKIKPKYNSLFECNNNQIYLSTIKKSEIDDSIILRVYNPTLIKQPNIKITSNYEFKIYLSDLQENKKELLNNLSFDLNPNEIKTFKLNKMEHNNVNG